MKTYRQRIGVNWLQGPAVLAVALASLAAVPSAPAQSPAAPRLMDQAPFDIVTLDKANESKVLRVEPLKLPGRQVPEKPKLSERLKLRLLDDGREYEVAWANIAKLDLYEQLVVAEARRFSAEGKFDDAYETIEFLLRRYPHAPGLADARQNFLYLSAGAAFRQKQHEEALAILEELLAQNPNYRAGASAPPLLQVLGNIAEPILAGYAEQQDFAALRTLLTRLASQHRAAQEPFVERWRGQLVRRAEQLRDSAREHLAAGRYLEAHDASAAMQHVWPDLPDAQELVAEIRRRYPLVLVGVEHPALAFDPTSLHDAAARRAGRLAQRLLVEQVGLGPESCQYASPLGKIEHSDDGLQLVFRLSPDVKGPDALTLAPLLASWADPAAIAADPAWCRLAARVRAAGPTELRVELRRAHVLPEALLQHAPGSAESAAGWRPFTTVPSDAAAARRFTLSAAYAFRRPQQLAEVVERFYDDPQRAVLALRQGEIDVLEHVFPGDLPLVRADKNLVVAPYALPTTHVLAVRSASPFLASRTFRRALLLGSNRELLLRDGLLSGQEIAGARVVSGPFPSPASGRTWPAYAYDATIEPRPYDPRLALTLKLLAESELKAVYEKQEQPAPKLGPLVLGHPADESARVACRGLVKQWQQIGVECRLVEFAPGKFADEAEACDLVYLRLAAWEPLIDAPRLFGLQGLIPVESPFVQLALRQVEEARHWPEARERLLALHRLLHEDAWLLPLWQTVDHYAYRRSLESLAAPRLRLYQDVDTWRVSAAPAEARP